MWKKIRTIVVFTLVVLLVCGITPGRSLEAVGNPEMTVAGPNIPQPDTTRAIQLTLTGYGYTVTVDGIYGPQTIRAVKAWQKANGLVVDGIAGPITLDSLGLKPAVRGEQHGDWEGLSGCDEMRWYRINAGLPEKFDSIGYRESRCQNDARPTLPAASCCRGYWAIHKGNITAPGYKAGAAACGIRTEWDYYGTSHEQKLASACFAKVLFDWYVSHPGSADPWRL